MPNCYACGENTTLNFSKEISHNVYYYDKCCKCGSVFMLPVRYIEYEKNYFLNKTSMVNHTNPIESQVRSNAVYKVIEPYFNKMNSYTILEIGFGNGQLMKKIPSYLTVDGVEISDYARTQIDDDFHVYKTIHDIPYHIKYGMIVMNDVLEHIENPLELINDCYCKLYDNGYIYLRFPNIEGFGYKFKKEKWSQIIPEHFNFTTKKGMEKMIDGKFIIDKIIQTPSITLGIRKIIKPLFPNVAYLLGDIKRIMFYPIVNYIFNKFNLQGNNITYILKKI